MVSLYDIAAGECGRFLNCNFGQSIIDTDTQWHPSLNRWGIFYTLLIVIHIDMIVVHLHYILQ